MYEYKNNLFEHVNFQKTHLQASFLKPPEVRVLLKNENIKVKKKSWIHKNSLTPGEYWKKTKPQDAIGLEVNTDWDRNKAVLGVEISTQEMGEESISKFKTAF